ncbi:lipid A deacylase LpxR family protein [Parvularcula sp. ZS-1/3]|uniref:Lipid A deacylase LpxR family protein n=1 Tax=Parvularcula mediterranea TaxID=2732508 RepID=A0A7Y3W5I6_9PROT|nr:lipid A deacylase LpxR family protein [Parvularcula mediterranea]NNU16805.1 lipid A deacylase LpxR family protein [Parvularcula mediterranea]
MVRTPGHILLSLLVSAALISADAQAEEKGTLTFTVENDVVSGQDRHYTNGLRLAYVTAPVEPNAFERLFTGEDTVVRRSFAGSQQIFTGEDITIANPSDDDHPYAGYLFGEYALLTEDDGKWQLFTLEAGVVGPSALGEDTQNWFHRSLNFYEAQGWDRQLEDEFALNIAYDWKGRSIANGKLGGLDMELTPVAGASFGNVAVNARGGAMWRMGPNLKPNFGPARIRPSLTGSGHFAREDSWFLFAGIEGRVVAHDLFIDGSLFQDGPSADKKAFVADAQAGVVFDFGGAQLSWTMVARSKRYEVQERGDVFGALSISVKM